VNKAAGGNSRRFLLGFLDFHAGLDPGSMFDIGVDGCRIRHGMTNEEGKESRRPIFRLYRLSSESPRRPSQQVHSPAIENAQAG